MNADDLTLEECIEQIAGEGGLLALTPWTYRWTSYAAPGNERLGIPALRFTDGPKGVNLGRSTCFPVAIARGATWDPALEYRVGLVMAKEARAQGANALGSTCVTVIRHPGWGRAQETFSSDPVVLSSMGAALVRGIQDGGVMAVVKHFALNSIENSRFRVSVDVDDRTLHEIYLPHFRACVEAGASGVMGAYNRFRGVHCCENETLLGKILKERWGFRGFVMSDFFFGCRSTGASLRAGLDLEMPWRKFFSEKRILSRVASGAVAESRVRDAAARVIRQKERVGLLDRGRWEPDPSVVGSRAHADVALECARRSIVLLKHDSRTLPFTADAIRSLAVIGPLARSPNLGSEGSVSVKPPYAVDLWSGLRSLVGGSVELRFDPGHDPDRAAALARECDAAVIAAGLRGRDEGEYFGPLGGGDRTRLELPRGQDALIRAVASARREHAVVLFGGSAIACGGWADAVTALLMAWYPGMMGGRALAEILFGLVNPSGKLPLSFPKRTEDLPPFDPKARRVAYDRWYDYRWHDREGVAPAFPFGHGLAYSPFVYEAIRVREVDAEGVACFEVDVRNAGRVDGDEVVQVYLSAPDSRDPERPPKRLATFARIRTLAGEKQSIGFRLGGRELAIFDPASDEWVVEPMRYEIAVGGSSADLPLRAAFTIDRRTTFR